MSNRTEFKKTDAKSPERNSPKKTFCLITPAISLQPGMICPRCKAAKIDYDGLLNLVCPNCGLTEVGAST